jgi:stress-induced morphogen
MTTEEIQKRLLTHFVDAHVEVVDMTGTSDHIQVFIKSNKFTGKTRMQRHRMVMDIFANELKTGEIHALTIQADDA